MDRTTQQAQTQLGAAAIVIAAVGLIMAIASDDDPSTCEILRSRLDEIESRYGEPIQSWDQILTINDDGVERSRLLRALAANDCP